MASSYFYYILFVRRKSKSSVNNKEEGVIKGHEYHKQKSLEAIFEAAYSAVLNRQKDFKAS